MLVKAARFGVKDYQMLLVAVILLAIVGICSGRDFVIIDADTTLFAPVGLDIDDDLAIIFALNRPNVEVVALSVTHANAPLFITCSAAKELVKTVEAKIEVGCGLGYFTDFKDTQHRETCGFLAKQTMEAVKRQQDGDRIILIGLGANTNIACALFHYPELKNVVSHLYIMGGSFKGPELNFAVDWNAAEYVLGYCGVEKTLIPVQACQHVAITTSDIAKHILDSPNCQGKLIHDYGNTMWRHSWKNKYTNALVFGEGPDPVQNLAYQGFHPWDVVAVIYALESGDMLQEIFGSNPTTCYAQLSMGTGWTLNGVISPDANACVGECGVRVLNSIRDQEAFKRIFFSTICNQEKVYSEKQEL
mmetsp:Transcript_28484/g.45907  ORF Transcript_28484/g.45907 Transcript_28484/m.45907 type:complete len:361 (+) Transcript_28484:16-1098(+)